MSREKLEMAEAVREVMVLPKRPGGEIWRAEQALLEASMRLSIVM